MVDLEIFGKSMKNRFLIMALAALTVRAAAARAEITIITDHNDNEDAAPAFHFQRVPPPSKTGTAGRFTIVDGEFNGEAHSPDKLNDGHLPTEEDQPKENFCFGIGTPGGRLRLDLNQVKTIQQINTYSWHPNTRGPQVYKVYGATGTKTGFNAAPKFGTDPAFCGWTPIALVDTRPRHGEPGGQYGVSISDSAGALGDYRYLLFECSATEMDDPFGNTFYSEINVLGPAEVIPAGTPLRDARYRVHTPDGKYEIIIDTSLAADLTEWATNKLPPVLLEWYPKIVAYLPSEDYEAPKRFRVILQPIPDPNVAAQTIGTRVNASIAWIKRDMNGRENHILGALMHEAVHVAQQYGSTYPHNPHPAINPAYLVEGIADYYRFFIYEPQTKGAEIRGRDLENANYDDSYRVTANFLNWVGQKYDKDLVVKINAVMRAGHYSTNLWTKYTGKTVEQLNAEWKDDLKKKIEGAAAGGGQ
jgi:hypothetical protein